MAKRKRKHAETFIVVRRGEPGWGPALAACSRIERWVASKYGVIQFREADERAEIVRRHRGTA
jgi:hypothetical protein